ncbi:hypothetical protein HDZ31DRAFT_49247 [Schizophyllum fasciatum]
MDDPSIPAPPASSPPVVYFRSNLELRLREEIKSTPYLFIALLLHFLYRPSFSRRHSLSSAGDTEFIKSAKAEVATTVAELKRREGCNDFIVKWRFGNSYRRLWKEQQMRNEGSPKDLLAWVDEWEVFQWGVPDEEALRVTIHVGGDLAKPLTFALECKAFDDVFTPANILRRLACRGVEPSVTSIYLRLPNGAMLEISWFEAIPAPASPWSRELHLELHSRGWRHSPKNTIHHRPTGRFVLLLFFNFLSDVPNRVQAPVLEGGWLVLAHALPFLRGQGVKLPKGCIVMRRSAVNPSCLIEASLADPIALPEKEPSFLSFHILCGKCMHVEPIRTHAAKHHFCNEP